MPMISYIKSAFRRPRFFSRLRYRLLSLISSRIVPPENSIGLLSEFYNAYQTSFEHIRTNGLGFKRVFQTALYLNKLKSILYARLKIKQRITFKLTQNEKERIQSASGPKVIHIISIMEIGGSQKIILDMFKQIHADIRMIILTGKIAANTYFPDLPITALNSSKDIGSYIQREKPDIVHFHYWGLDLWMQMVLDTIIPMKQQLGFKLIENCNNPIPIFYHQDIDHYIFVSQFVIDMQTIPLPKEDCQVIYPGVNTDEFFFSQQNKDTMSAGMVYRITNDKINRDTIELLIKLCQEIPGLLIYVIGDGPNLTHFIRRSNQESVRNQICFTGFVPFERLPEYYDRFHIYIAPVLHESYGVVTPYAMAKGNPIVANRIDCLEELLNSKEMLCDNEEEFIQKTKYAILNPENNDNLVARNRSRAENVFSLHKMLRDYETVYFSLSENR